MRSSVFEEISFKKNPSFSFLEQLVSDPETSKLSTALNSKPIQPTEPEESDASNDSDDAEEDEPEFTKTTGMFDKLQELDDDGEDSDPT